MSLSSGSPGLRSLLVVHAIAGGTLVGCATHQLLWCRNYIFGKFVKVAAEKRFVTLTTIAFVATFLIGNVLYPSYRVRVRGAYFDEPRAVQATQLRIAADSAALGETPPAQSGVSDYTGWSRFFDIKEHVASFAIVAQLGLWLLSRRAHPKENPATAPLYTGLALFNCLSVWFALIVGLFVTSHRTAMWP